MEYARYLYRLTFPDDKVYIGITSDIKSRWAGGGAHYKGLAVRKHIQKYGWENVKKEIILETPESGYYDQCLRRLEKDFVKAIKPELNLNIQYTEAYSQRLIGEHRHSTCLGKTPTWEIDGVTKSIGDWCRQYETSQAVVENRIKSYNMTVKEALSFPKVPRGMSKRAVEYWESLGYVLGGDDKT